MSIIAFSGSRCLAQGSRAEVTRAARLAAEASASTAILAFDAVNSHPVELDLRAPDTTATPPQPLEEEAARGRGRPKLGVTSREITLLPRHWDWLNAQRGGASAALRRLVEDALRADGAVAASREGKESLYRFITAMAGDAPGYEEAVRALFADDEAKFKAESAGWPEDVRAHALTLLGAALDRRPSP